jgi:hypothetical protein
MKMTEEQTAMYDRIMTMANAHYAEAKAKRLGIDLRYTAPEALPKIESDQVKSLAKAIVMVLKAGE